MISDKIMYFIRLSVLLLTFACRFTSFAAAEFFGPSPYLAKAESPFHAGIVAGSVLLEDFEGGFTNGAPFYISGGALVRDLSTTDSVDFGINGSSWWSGFAAGATVTISFSPAQPGGLPSDAGLVWTDGNQNTSVTFEAFDAASNSLGTVVATLGDNSIRGTQGEDRFFGVRYPDGISGIKIKNVGGQAIEGLMRGIEIDHVQFGKTPLSLTMQGNRTLCWNSQSNRLYQVQFSSTLQTNSWIDIGDRIPGGGGTTCFLDPTSNQPQKFYRVVIIP